MPEGRRQVGALLLATLVGLSWFVLARVSFQLSRKLVLAGWWHGVPWWHVLSTVRLVLGLFVYIPVAVLVVRRSASSSERPSVVLGLFPPTWAAVACGAVLVSAGVLAVGPAVVYSRVLSHLGSSPMSVLGALQPPVVEELLARGIVWEILAAEFPAAFALVWSSLLFWTWHLEFGLTASLVTGAYGAIVAGGARLVSGTIWVGLLFHLMANANAGQELFPTVLVIGGVWLLATRVRSRRGRTSGCS